MSACASQLDAGSATERNIFNGVSKKAAPERPCGAVKKEIFIILVLANIFSGDARDRLFPAT